MEKFSTNMQQTNWTSGIIAGKEKERQTEAEVAISLFKVVDATPGQEPLPLTLYSIPSNPVTQGQIFIRKEVPNNLVANTRKYISEK
jgi:hypothetical protein